MGTTLAAIQAGGGFAYQVVVAVEGYEYLLTDGPTARAVTAWAGTDWTAALSGLSVRWPGRQQIQAWRADLDAPSLSFCLQPDGDDLFGKAVFGSSAGSYSPQAAPLDNDDTTVTVLNTGAFASSGAAYLGTERIAYTGKTGTALTGCTRGTHAPFRRNPGSAQRFGRYHPLGQIGDGIVINPHVSTAPRKWRGRWVGVWLHRVVGGVLDVRSEAQCIYAGRIVAVRDEADGLTWVECEDVRAAIKSTTLLSDQWTARLREGMPLTAGMRFNAKDQIGSTFAYANDLVVVDGTPGANEIAAGIYTLDELATALNDWWQAERAASRLNLVWTWSPRVETDSGVRSRFDISDGDITTTNVAYFKLPLAVFEFMGFSEDDFTNPSQVIVVARNATEGAKTSPQAPFLAYAPPYEVTSLYLDGITGQFFSQRSYLPQPLRNATLDDGNAYGVVQAGGSSGPMYIAEYRSDLARLRIRSHPLLDQISGTPATAENRTYARQRVDDSAPVEFRQVAIIHGEFDDLLTKLLASTGTAGYNHATYDDLPAQLGAAIPWEILGSAWLASVGNVAESSMPIDLVIEKPTRLSEVIGADLVARLAFFRWKNGGLRLATWATPTTATAEHTLTEDNKASAADAIDGQRTVANETDEWLCNVLKIEHNRVLSGGYRDATVIREQGSMFEHGVREPVTVSLRNTFAGLSAPGSSLDALIDQLAAQVRLFAQPLRLLRRTIGLPYYEGMAVGDVVSLTDRFARDPATGARGLTNRAALVVGLEIDWGGYEIDSGGVRQALGQVDLLVFPRERIAAYCPAVRFAGSAYTAGTKTVATTAHYYSEATDAEDATHFAAGDKVRIVEEDPDDPAAPQQWVDTVSSVSSPNIVLTAGLAGISSGKTYRLFSDEYSTATTTQRVDTYQARSADGLVASGVDAYEYGLHQLDTSITEEAGDENVSLYARVAYGQGRPLDVAYEWDATRLANVLAHHRTVVVAPALYRNVLGATVACHRRILAIEPIMLHPGELLGSMSKSLYLKPWLRSSNGDAVKLYATLCRRPPTGSSLLWEDADAPTYRLNGASATLEWETSSTTWAVGSRKRLDISILDPGTGMGYLVLEGERYLETRGMAMCQTAPTYDPIIGGP